MSGDLDPLSWINDALTELEQAGLRRRRTTRVGAQGPEIDIDGKKLVNFGSNDYLGLAADPRLIEAAAIAASREGWGAGASPLVTGRSQAQAELEATLARLEGTEAGLVFPSGFAANMGTIGSIVSAGDVVYSDALNHASLIDGCRLSRAAVHIYRHTDVGHLAELLDGHRRAKYRRRLIVTDSLFSMDGNLAPLAELGKLAQEHDAMLLVDEAHATGVFGAKGRGVAEYQQVESLVHVRVGTLSKGVGSGGGFTTGTQTFVDWVMNRGRPYIFSTALPAAVCAASRRAIEIIEAEPHRRTELLARAEKMRQALREQGWQVGASESQIIPIVIGDPDKTVAFAARLRERGLLVPPIRPPTVPPGTSRLRISLCWGHTDAMLGQLLDALTELRKGPVSSP